MVDDIGRFSKHWGEPASRSDLHCLAALGSDALDETLYEPDITPKHTRLHRRDRTATDHCRGPSDANSGKLRRRHIERPQRQIDAGSDDATGVIAEPVNHVERR